MSTQEKNYLDLCPITGNPYFMLIKNTRGEMVPTYGGPLDSYTIPEKDEDGNFITERFCHDDGCWKQSDTIYREDIIKRAYIDLFLNSAYSLEFSQNSFEKMKTDIDNNGWWTLPEFIEVVDLRIYDVKENNRMARPKSLSILD